MPRKAKDASATRELIQGTALRLFVEKGVTETTIRDLASAAGIAEGTLYRHYVSKDELVHDLFQTNYGAFGRKLRDVQQAHGAFPDKLAAMIETICQFYDSDPICFRFLLLAQHQALPRIDTGADNPVQVLHNVIAEAMERGEITARDPDLATGFVLGLLLQPAVLMVYGRLTPPFAALAPEITAACWRVLNP
ncbi:TetR/AcrR family transcriptional regulator [Telmatospirillum sp. J64-1]|uniref:TetR/AcrR family transcriptional regulator n=1 Tax=Telmatospirillum sp. J64-1 TaxID=2502183 RepID=UPI00115C5E76|nr:TetR/AcrR family transcriptional regulator [Telmatospirillum sp. J64-1]